MLHVEDLLVSVTKIGLDDYAINRLMNVGLFVLFNRYVSISFFYLKVTTPPMNFDQDENVSETTNTFSLPVMSEKDSKYIFYGLHGSNKNDIEGRTMISNSDEISAEPEVLTTIQTIPY